MKTHQAHPHSGRQAAARPHREKRPSAAANAIAHSPRITAQRQAIQAAFGAAAGLARDAPAQRMVAVAAADMSSVDDSLVLNNMDYALGHFGGPVGDFVAHRKFDATGPGDRVGIINHGAPGQVGGYDAEAVAGILTRKPGIHPKLASIVLYSCNAGMDQELKGPDSSLVHGLSAALKDRGYEIGVEGQKGIAFGFRGIGERTTKGTEQEGDSNWFGTRDELLATPAYSAWKGSDGGFVPADELLAVAGGLSKQAIGGMSMEDKAHKIAELMAPFWREVEKKMGSTLYDHLKGWVRVTSYVSGGQLVQDSR